MPSSTFRILTLILAGLVTSCGNKTNQPLPTAPAQNNLISAVTSGEISAVGEIGITFSQEVEESAQKNAVTGISFTPAIRGKFDWVNSRTLVFTPDSPLKNGHTYTAQLDLQKFFAKSESTATYTFNFSTIQQEIEIKLGALRPMPNNANALALTGTIFTADVAALNELKKSVSASMGTINYSLNWLTFGDQKSHRFEILGIERMDAPADLSVQWNGAPIGSESHGVLHLPIPEKGAFELIDTRVFRDENPRVELTFSDPIDASQNFIGLIALQSGNALNVIVADNQLIVNPRRRVNGEQTLIIDEALQSATGKKLGVINRRTINFFQPKPRVLFLANGVIIPRSKDLFVPFKAVSLGAVDVHISRVFESNIGQFLQDQNLNGTNSWNMRRVARPIYTEVVPLSTLGAVDPGEWNNYTLDLSKMIEPEPGAIYQVEIGFRPHQAVYPCKEGNLVSNDIEARRNWELPPDQESGYWESFGGYFSPLRYNWRDRDNPCTESYYSSNRRVKRNVLASDLGIIAKEDAQNNTTVFVTDLRNADPIAGVSVSLVDYQQQEITRGRTDVDGKVELKPEREAYYIIAEMGDQKGYLRVDDGTSLSLSNFDVSGARVQNGIKGFLYGERGVWRPGDSLFVTLMLEDKSDILPEDHPITFELRDPAGQLVDRETQTASLNGMYVYRGVTTKQAPTGNWRLHANVGGQTFSKTLKIETVKPNRLKVELDFKEDNIKSGNRTIVATLSSQWLHGATARSLKADVEMMLRPSEPEFDHLRGYSFIDETVSFNANPAMVYDGQLSDQGSVDFTHTLPAIEQGPPRLRADFNLRVFEPSGSFSVGRASSYIFPFRTIVGIQAPIGENNRYGNWLNRNETQTFEIVSVDAEGKPVGRRDLEYQVYHLRWRWWWERGREDLSNYFERENVRKVASGTLQTRTDGTSALQFKLPNGADGGRYLIRVNDPKGNHSASTVVYFSWGKGRNSSASPAQLTFTSDKQAYETGENVTLSIPSSKGSKLLVSLETGSKILETVWLDGSANETTYSFTADERMSPNVFAHVMHIQPHGQSDNDLPMRMYGVIPILVNNPQTILKPELSMEDEFRPESPATIKVTEENGRAMTYTIAMVDDGLLDLTNFNTPKPHGSFYAREALGIKTWDLYSYVASGFSGTVSRILSIGGDGEELASDPLNEANRFEPMVRFKGPFYLDAGKTNTHQISIPNYVGSVRTMLIAGQHGSYGQTEKTTPVRKPVMVLATLPRVLGPAESVTLPVSVFAMDPSVDEVEIEIEANDLFEIEGESSSTLSFDEPGDQIVTFSLKTKPKIGVGKVRVEAKSGRETAYHEIEIAVRNPNTPFAQVIAKNLSAGEEWSLPLELQGMLGTNSASLELSRIPPIDFSKRMRYLIRYPHGCIEQTTSAVFAQLFAGGVMELDEEQRKSIQLNIEEGIERINKFLTPGGGLSYWPGDEDANSWGTSYAYHFLIEAQKRGYYVPSTLLANINQYQSRLARRWSSTQYRHSDLMQAYRLYTLALAATPELGAMNRFRERENLSAQARWRIAAAYALIAQKKAANDIVLGSSTTVDEYRELSGSFGSSLRDQAMILETLALLNREEEATDLSRTIASALSTQQWYSTQTTAYGLIAVSKFLNLFEASGELEAEYDLSTGSTGAIQSTAFIRQVPLAIKEQQENELRLVNNSEGTLFARVILEGTPLLGDNISASNNLVQRVRYLNLAGEAVDPTELNQGQDVIMEIAVQNPGLRGHYQQMALTSIFPSGWELRNTRMDGEAFKEPASNFDYQDIRDDRVYTYFELAPNTTKLFRFQLNASYLGRYYLPSVSTNAMYDETINARTPGQWVRVVTLVD